MTFGMDFWDTLKIQSLKTLNFKSVPKSRKIKTAFAVFYFSTIIAFGKYLSPIGVDVLFITFPS